MEMNGTISLSSAEDDDHSFPLERWEKLLGLNNWMGLIEPNLDIELRRFIIRCGDFCKAAYKAFKGGVDRPKVTLKDIELPDPQRYKTHSFLYATMRLNLLEKVLQIPAKNKAKTESHTQQHVPNLMGYCASTTNKVSKAIGRREIYIAWRGTETLFEWRNNLMFYNKGATRLLRNFNRWKEKKPRIMHGWLSIYTSSYGDSSSLVNTSARDQVHSEVRKLLDKYRGEKISIVVTGHSLGGALAIISAFDLVENIVGRDISVAAVVFSSPKVGNKEFKRRAEKHPNLKILHVKEVRDLVPQVPPFRRYVCIGKELVVDTLKSPIDRLRISPNPAVVHDLEAVLHLVAGWNGPDKAFKFHVNRCMDMVLENGHSGLHVKWQIRQWFHSIKDMIDVKSH